MKLTCSGAIFKVLSRGRNLPVSIYCLRSAAAASFASRIRRGIGLQTLTPTEIEGIGAARHGSSEESAS